MMKILFFSEIAHKFEILYFTVCQSSFVGLCHTITGVSIAN
jgi:hypothetical protein